MYSGQENNCYNCRKVCLKGDNSIIKAVGHIYHKQCFRCDLCQVSVIDKFYVNEKDYGTVLLCEKDYYEHYQYQCHQCRKEIIQDDYEMIGQYKYHPECLHCPGCQISSATMEKDNGERFEYNGKPYCRFHYSMIKGTECQGCKQTILYQYKLKDDIKWHPECYMLKKYWQIEIVDLLGDDASSYKSKCHLILTQDESQNIRERLWEEMSQFEDFTSRTISNIILQSNDSKHQYESCLYLIQQTSIVFHVLDNSSNLSYEQLVYVFTRDMRLFLDYLDQSNHILKVAEKISNHFKDLLKFSLQQVIRLSGQDHLLLNHFLILLSSSTLLNHAFQSTVLNDSFHLIHSALVQHFSTGSIDRSHIINHFSNLPNMDGRSDETLIYKTSKNTTTTTDVALLSESQHNTMVHLSRSSTTKHTAEADTKTYMNTLKRALTTSRHKKNRPLDCPENPLHISLPDVEQAFTYTTPPLSPPTTIQQQYAIPTYLPELTQPQQDPIIRHLSTLYLQLDEASIENLFSHKKSTATSLWGKLKTHILTPSSEPPPSLSMHENNNKKRIGVSLTNLSCGSLSSLPTSSSFENWAQSCPSIRSCFSTHAQVPHFIQDCVLAIIDQDMHTEGLFRKNGNIRGIKEMCETINTTERDNWYDYFREQPIVQLTVFIKKFLRELPEPLLPSKLYKLFLSCKLDVIHYTLCLLPKPNRDLLFLILALLNWVARHSDDNKMDYENLARVIAPNILYVDRADDSKTYSTQDLSTCHQEIEVVSFMIEHYESLVKVPESLIELLNNSQFSSYIEQHSIDLTFTKQFIKHHHHLQKIKKALANPVLLPPSPSISFKHSYPL